MKKPRLQAGIDISKNKFDLCLLTSEGDILVRHRVFSNTRSGYQGLRDVLLEAWQAGDFAGIDIGGESTGPYWMPLFLQMQADSVLAAYDFHIYLLNARHVYWFKKGAAEAEKTDAKDSFFIAEKLRTQNNKQPWSFDPEWLRLRFYTRYRFHLGQQRTRLKNAFWATMFLWCNLYAPRQPFADGLGACGRMLIRTYPDWQRLQEMSSEALGAQLAECSRRRLSDPTGQAEQIQQIIQESFPVPPALTQVLHHLLTLHLDHLAFIEQQIRQVERLIKIEVDTHHPEVKCLMSTQGIGLVLAAGIASEIGNLSRFFAGEKWDRRKQRFRRKNLRDVEDAVSKYAGLWWPRKESGNFRAEDRRLNKQGNAYLRYYLVEAADKLRQYLPEYRAYYERKYREVKTHQHKRALVLTARKSVGLFVGLLHRKEAYRSPEERLNN